MSKYSFDLLETDEKIYFENEYKANVFLTKALAITGILFALFLILLFTPLFDVENLSSAVPFFVANIILLCSPTILTRTKLVYKKWYKYFLILLIVVGMAIFNTVFPKHGVIGWALVIILSCHYYDSKVSLMTFVITAIAMCACLYGGMVYGEWDAQLLDGSERAAAVILGLPGADGLTEFKLTTAQRIEYINTLHNRWVIVLPNYLLPRFVLLFLVSFACHALANRTGELLGLHAKEAVNDEKVQSELSVAAGIQLSALPKKFPNNIKYDMFALMQPARAVGGDFYDFIEIDEKRTAFLVADVSGKGIPAAMFMMKAKTLIKTLLKSETDLGKILTYANQELCDGNDKEMFVTCFLGLINVDTGEFKYVNAGHNPILLKHADGGFEYLRKTYGFVLAAIDDFVYKEKSMTLEAGDELFLYTDGVTEANSKNGLFFGEDRLQEALNKCTVHDSKVLCESVKKELDSFCEGTEQFDDITMMGVRYFGDYRREIHVPSEKTNIDQIYDFIEENSGTIFDKKTINKIKISIDEIFTNICDYAYDGKIDDVRIIISRNNKDTFYMIFTDHGKPFNPLEADDPDITLSAEERGIGGLGIFMVKQIMDDIRYTNIDGNNILILEKKISGCNIC